MTSLTRHMVLKTASLATTSLATPFVCEVHAAGKLSIGFGDQAKMIVHCTQGGKPRNRSVDWAMFEIGGFTRM